MSITFCSTVPVMCIECYSWEYWDNELGLFLAGLVLNTFSAQGSMTIKGFNGTLLLIRGFLLALMNHNANVSEGARLVHVAHLAKTQLWHYCALGTLVNVWD